MRSYAPTTSSRLLRDRILGGALRASAVLSGGILLIIVAFVGGEALPALSHPGPVRLLSDDAWRPADGRYGLGPMLAGTLLVGAGALLIAAPLGVATAIFRRFYAPARIARPFGGLVALLAGIPSVVYGLFGLMVVVPLVASVEPPGQSLLAGSLVLALMVVPTVAMTADAALRSVPRELLHGAAALGLARWAVVRHVALRSARRGIRTGIVLATGRALGETMAVLMVCGNVVQVPGSPFEPVRTLTAGIALEMAYALERHRSVLFAAGLLLMLLVTGLALAASGRWRTPHG